MTTKSKSDECAWTRKWLENVANGKSTMSQRKVSSIETKGGGLDIARREALNLGVHLVRLEDDQGNDLVAASRKPFKVIA